MIDLLQWDRAVFDWINSDASCSLFDVAMPWLSHLGDAAAVWLWIALIGLLMIRELSRSIQTAQGKGP
jgi:hypothetical protein